MLYRENGQFKTTYRADQQVFPILQDRIFIGPALGGGIEIWFGYVLVLVVLLVRPQGLFGEKIIDRV